MRWTRDKVLQTINKIKNINPFKSHANEQAGLVLVASLPCLVIALIAMRLAGASFYLISFSAIILLLLIIYAAISGKNRANYQINTLSNLVEAMIDGDYSLRGRSQSNPAFQELLNLINQLANTLHRHKLKAEESQLLLEKIMQQMDTMVIATNPEGQVAIANNAARKAFNINLEKPLKAGLVDIGLEQLTQANGSGIIKLTQDSLSTEYFLFSDQFYSNNQKHQLYLLTKADKLLREKEREAWQSLLRVLSHELNNSLTPIATFSNTMLRKINRENEVSDLGKFRDGLNVIKERAESLNQFITSYSQLSHLPSANLQDYAWREKIEKLTQLFSDCQFENKMNSRSELDFIIQADQQQLEQVFINLFKNARESMQQNAQKLIEIDACISDENLIIYIKDSGTGIANPDNLFIPFYTTKKSGSGIGLTLCQQILLNHNASLQLKNRQDASGAEAVIVFPLNNMR